MATITGNVKFVTNTAARQTLTFVPKDTPVAVGSSVAIKTETTTLTDANGDITAVTLLAGKYTVEFSNGESFDIDVPSGSGTHALPDIIDTSGSASDTSLYARRVYAGSASVALTGTSEANIIGTGVGSLVLAANFFTAGKTLRGIHRGYLTTTATPGTLTPRLKINGTTAASLTVTPYSSVGGQHIRIEWGLTCWTAGASGILIAEMESFITDTTAGSVKRFCFSDTANVDGTAAITISMTGQFSAASQSAIFESALLEAVP